MTTLNKNILTCCICLVQVPFSIEVGVPFKPGAPPLSVRDSLSDELQILNVKILILVIKIWIFN